VGAIIISICAIYYSKFQAMVYSYLILCLLCYGFFLRFAKAEAAKAFVFLDVLPSLKAFPAFDAILDVVLIEFLAIMVPPLDLHISDYRLHILIIISNKCFVK
jgi:hypothetical protein